MYKSLIRAPLEQAMVLLWAYGLVRLALWLSGNAPTPKWAVSAGIAALVLMLIGARLRARSAAPVWVLIGLASVMSAAYLGGVESPAGFATVAAVFVFALWSTTLGFLSTQASSRILEFGGFRGGYAAPGGRYHVERRVYWTGLAVVLFCVTSLMTRSWAAAPAAAIPILPWQFLTLALAYLLCGGARYRFPPNTYLAATLAVLGVFAVYGLVTRQDAPLTLAQAPTGALLALCAGLAWTVAAIAWRRGGRRERGAAYAALYGQPLRTVAGVLSVLAMLQALFVAAALYADTAGPGWVALSALAAASAVLLLVNRQAGLPALTAMAAFGAGVSIVWTYSAVTAQRPPFGLSPGGPAAGGQWLICGLATLALAVAGSRLARSDRWRLSFGQPMLVVAGAGFLWTLLGAIYLMPAGDPAVTWVIATQTGALFPLLRNVANGEQLRGPCAGLLLSLLAAAALGPSGRAAYGAQAAIAWAFVLWFGGTFALPVFNRRLPAWAVAPQSWPWLGLATLVLGLALAVRPGVLHWGLALIAAAYLFLMLRHTALALFAWLGVGALTFGVVLFSAELHGGGRASGQSFASFGFWHLAWANVLLISIPLWQRFARQVNSGLGLRDHDLRPPMLFFAGAICVSWLLALSFWDAALLWPAFVETAGRPRVALFGAALVLTVLHLNVRWSARFAAHLLIATALAALVSVWGIAEPFHPALALALFTALVATSWTITQDRFGVLGHRLHGGLSLWLVPATLASIVATVVLPAISLTETLGAYAILTGVAAYVGWHRQSAPWVYVGAMLGAVLLHGVWSLWLSSAYRGELLPIYALQFAVLTWVLRTLTLRARAVAAESQQWFTARMLGHLTISAAVIGVVELVAHVAVTVLELLAGQSIDRITPVWGQAAALAAPLVLSGRCIVESHRAPQEQWFYSAAALIAAAGVYGRLLLFGVAPPGVWDTAAIIGASYALFALQAITKSKAALNLTLWLPLAALLTVPFQLASAHATLVLFSIGALYVLTRRSTGTSTPLYLALLAINAGIYLWIPDWAGRVNLLQIYLLPAALSVLFLVHLHRKEIKRSVANGVRLAALSTLYGVATLDVFLQENLSVFALALGLSIAGIGLGIVTRTRAFLYAGTVFLVVNVLGQLLQMYPEQRLGRAILLMALGAGVTALMIWFNLQRERILRRIRIARADLAQWE